MIRRLLVALRSQLRRFGLAREGAAAVEFALIVPFMLALYVGSIELSDLINVDRRVTVIAGTVGDLVSRTDGTLPASVMDDYFNAAQEILTPYTTAGLKQLIICVQVNGAGVARVRWSSESGGATKPAYNSVVALPAAITDISLNKYVIVSETSYDYKPLMGMMFQTAINLHRQNFHLPRFGNAITLVND